METCFPRRLSCTIQSKTRTPRPKNWNGNSDRVLLVVYSPVLNRKRSTSGTLSGISLLGIVAELTDDKNLPSHERKHLQIVNACHLSADAIPVRLADKIYNLRDLNRVTPQGWSDHRVREYFLWSAKIARQLFGHNQALDNILKDLYQGREIALDQLDN